MSAFVHALLSFDENAADLYADIKEKYIIATVKRIMKSLQDKNYIRRESGKRYGRWEVLV